MAGVHVISSGLGQVFGSRARFLLLRFTSNPVQGLLAGIAASAVLQSSSFVTVLLVSLGRAGVLNDRKALGVMLGANVGTCLTVHLVALPVKSLALPLVCLGAAVVLFGKRDVWQGTGFAAFGCGAILWAMDIMAASFTSVRFDVLLQQLTADGEQGIMAPLVAMAAGTVFTAVIQSSSAAMALVVGLAKGGPLSLELATGWMLGANIGTCLTAILAGIGANLTGKRIALAHLLFNAGGVLLFLPLLPLFTAVITLISPTISLAIANAHLLFNLITAVLALPLVGSLSDLTRRILA